MTDEARQRTAAAAASGGGDAALHALRWAAAWSAQVLRERAAQRAEPLDPDDPEAIASVILVDDALTELSALTAAVPALIADADPGQAVTDHLNARQADLGRSTGLVAEARSQLDELGRRAAAVQAKLAEHAELRSRVTELRRAERLAGALDELAGQQAAVDDRLAVIADPVAAAQRGLSDGSESLLRLSRQRREALEPAVRDLLERAAAEHDAVAGQESALASTEADLAATSARHQELRALHEERRAALTAHAGSDRAVADALAPPGKGAATSGLQAARLLLDRIEEQLRDADRALGAALTERDQQVGERAPLAWSSGQAARQS